MKKLLLLVAISSIAMSMVGCKGEDTGDATADTTSSSTGATGGTPPPVNAAKAGGPKPGIGADGPSATADDGRWKAGTMVKGGDGK